VKIGEDEYLGTPDEVVAFMARGEGAPGHPLRASACASAPAAAAMAGSHGASAAREARSVGAPASAESA